MSLFHASVPTPIGALRVLATARGVVEVCFTACAGVPTAAPALSGDPQQVAPRIRRWFAGDLAALDDLPVDVEATAFQRAVWDRLRTVPPGTTTTYGALAVALGRDPGASRAVGSAVGANRLALVVPCHRVLPASGGVGGFAWGVERKRWLLDHEARRR